MVEVKRAEAGQGVAWITEGFRIFLKSPGMWVVLGLALIVIYVVLAQVPLVGGLVISLIAPVLAAGMLHAAREAREGRPLEFSHLWRGFQQGGALNGLIALGAVMLAGALASVLVMALSVGGSFMATMHAGGAEAMSPLALGAGGLVGLLLALLIQLLVLTAVVYAVPLVLFKGAPAGAAMSLSLRACVVNFLPLLIFSVIYIVVAIVAALPFGLGLLVLLPASFGMLYASYRDCFTV
jgi:uncharacterized membrane protein